MKKAFLFMGLLSLASCSEQNPVQEESTRELEAPIKAATDPAESTRTPSPQPDSLRLAPSEKFSLDTEQELFSFPVNGAAHHQLLAHLADRDGRRSISYLRDGVKEELASPQFHLPPVGALNMQGESLVCYNRLVGEPSERTEGAMPDPTQGVHLFCRFYDGEAWSRELRLGQSEIAAWTQSVTALNDGSFRVVYLADEGWLMDLNPRHSILSQRVNKGVVDEPVLVRPYTSITP